MFQNEIIFTISWIPPLISFSTLFYNSLAGLNNQNGHLWDGIFSKTVRDCFCHSNPQNNSGWVSFSELQLESVILIDVSKRSLFYIIQNDQLEFREELPTNVELLDVGSRSQSYFQNGTDSYGCNFEIIQFQTNLEGSVTGHHFYPS